MLGQHVAATPADPHRPPSDAYIEEDLAVANIGQNGLFNRWNGGVLDICVIVGILQF